MFERRLKLLLVILSMMVAMLLLRAGQFQIVERATWAEAAEATQEKTSYPKTTRGAIVDRKGRELAIDRPCVDACVDYRAILRPAQEKWRRDIATERLRARLGDAWIRTPKKQRETLRQQEMAAVQKDVDAMWDELAEASIQPPKGMKEVRQAREGIEEIRQAILNRVEVSKRYIWYQNFKRAGGAGDAAHSDALWQKWLSGDSADGPSIDKFAVTVAEELVPHVFLHAINLDIQNQLGRHIDKYPGLVLRPGTTRYYPYDEVACHVLGHMGKVNRPDLLADPFPDDQRRRYQLQDGIGRGGLEWLCEPALRGQLGRVSTRLGEDSAEKVEPPVPGGTVRASIDVDLQQEIREYFASATLHDTSGHITERGAVLHGAAVLLDVKTNQVLALVSYPTYNLNTYDQDYSGLEKDLLNERLRNRATESQLEPGSTVKPMVGLAAITQGLIKVNEGIECTGYLILDNGHGKSIRFGRLGRCWTASTPSIVAALNGAVAHHPVPNPHHGHDGNPDGFLTFSDAEERSCNVYFETVADRLGMNGLTEWMRRFGLGRKTGIGIEEYEGRLPGNAPRAFGMSGRATCFFAGIGQGYVAATPIQMANVASTIARNGIWMRPRIVVPDETGAMPEMKPGVMKGSDVVDLHLDPQALAACKLGMINVVNGPAGTGKAARMAEILVAGKTGTAQASPFRRPVLDAAGNPLRDENGKLAFEELALSTPSHPNAEAPWYRGSGPQNDKIDHAWMIGYAPADDPKIAFAVLVEYGGSGGGAAADVVKASLEACIVHGYLQPTPAQTGQSAQR